MNVNHHRDVVFCRQITHHFHDFNRCFWVERRGGLVREQQTGRLHHRPCNAYALPLSARQFVGATIGKIRQPHALQKRKGFLNIRLIKLASPGSPRIHVAKPPREHVLHHGQSLDQVVFLKHHADAATRLTERLPRQFGEVLPLKQNLARGRINQSIDAADQRGFAGAGRADDRGDAATLNVQGDVFEYGLAGDVFFDEMLNR